MEHRKIVILTWLSALLLLSWGCSSEEKQSSDSTSIAVAQIPDFSADSAYKYVQEQVALGPRVPGTEAQEAGRDYIAGTLERHGAEVQIQPFSAERYDGEKLTGYNIIGSFAPEAQDRILLCAHWDSRFQADQGDESQAVPGANDGASGVGVWLEVARHLQQQPPGVGIDIVFFDLEDQGTSLGNAPQSWALGAQHWSRNPHRPAYRFRMGILLDMVGAENARFYKEGFSQRYAGRWVDRIWSTASNMGYGNYFIDESMGAVTDDHYFVNVIAGIPTLDIIHKEKGSPTGFFSHWHTTGDDIDIIDRQTLKAVGRVVTQSVYEIAPEL
jgi:hypothetical protein